MASFGSFDTTEEETNSIDTEYKVPTVARTETDAFTKHYLAIILIEKTIKDLIVCLMLIY